MSNVTDDAILCLADVNSAPADDAAEAKLTAEIKTLWSAHQTTKATAKQTKEELADLRLDLGWKLSELKRILARTGRSGGWAAYLRSQGIPRATAERHVTRFEGLSNRGTNRTAETICAPTEDDVRRCMRNLWPKLSQVLKTREAVEFFIVELRQRFEDLLEVETPAAAEVGPAGVMAGQTLMASS